MVQQAGSRRSVQARAAQRQGEVGGVRAHRHKKGAPFTSRIFVAGWATSGIARVRGTLVAAMLISVVAGEGRIEGGRERSSVWKVRERGLSLLSRNVCVRMCVASLSVCVCMYVCVCVCVLRKLQNARGRKCVKTARV